MPSPAPARSRPFHLDGASSAHAAQPVPAAEVDVAPVIAKSITDWQSYSGRPRGDRQGSKSGRSSRAHFVAVYFKDGSLVKKGDPLFLIDPRPYQAEVDPHGARSSPRPRRRSNYASTDSRARSA